MYFLQRRMKTRTIYVERKYILKEKKQRRKNFGEGNIFWEEKEENI